MTSLPTDVLDLGTAPPVVHHVERHPGASHLVAVLPGLRSDDPRRGWPQRGRLEVLPVHRLFVETQLRPLPDPYIDLVAILAFLDAAREALAIPARHTVACGSSLGGTAAVVAGLRLGLGHVIAGSPIVLLERWAADLGFPEETRRAVEVSRWPGRFPTFVLDAVREAPGPTHIDYFVGDDDAFYPHHADALVAAAGDTGGRVTVDVTVARGITHANMYRSYARHMVAAVRKLAEA